LAGAVQQDIQEEFKEPMRAKIVSYKEFGALRLRDFFPKRTKLEYEEDGAECALGYSGHEAFLTTYFAWPVDRPNEVGEILLDFRKEERYELPQEVARRILNALKLPLSPSMSEAEVLRALGRPSAIDRSAVEISGIPVSSLFFRGAGEVGEEYEIECYVHRDFGLTGVRIVREDLRERAP
jgi:hypothetical protein